MKSVFDRIPEVSFIDDKTMEEEREELVREYEKKYMELTGQKNYTLPKASPYRIILNSIALFLYQGWMWLDKMGKMNLLKYAYGNYLDQVGAVFGVERKQGDPARTMIRFTLSAVQTSAVSIPRSTRCTNGYVYFKTMEAKEVASGEMYVEIEAECTDAGKHGNGLAAGNINILVDSVPYISEVRNTGITMYGTDVENDEDFRERIYLASSTFSVAGPENAYIYFAKEYSSLINDVRVTNPSPRVVDIRVVLKNGELPNGSFCNGLKQYLSGKDKRPLTDVVEVAPPAKKNYEINVKYFVNASEISNLSSIQKSVEEAVRTYKEWQSSKIGRDINPSQLIGMMINAGAKRVEVISPIFEKTDNTDVPICNGQEQITYGGIEDD